MPRLAKPLPEQEEDVSCTRVQCVLLGKHQEMLLPNGFLRGAYPNHSLNGWKVFRSYTPPPCLTSSTSGEARYAVAPVSFALGMNAEVILTSAAIVVRTLATKRGCTPPPPPALPVAARVIAVLLGGVYNSTRQRTDKRRWLLVQLSRGESYLTPLNKESVLTPAM
eukprot:6179357-Pleurochrysis_carterae.AAC.1